MRRVAQQFPDASAGFRHSFRRGNATTSRPKSRVLKPWFESRPSHPRGESPRKPRTAPLSEELRKILSPEACRWLEGKPYPRNTPDKGKQPSEAPPSKAQPAVPVSQEMIEFERSDTSSEDMALAHDEDGEELEPSSRRLPAGTLVEVRRHEVGMHAVVLYSVLLGRRWLVNSLTVTGEFVTHHEHDVTFQMPKFTTKEEAEACGLFQAQGTEAQMAARVNIVTELRDFRRRFEHNMHRIEDLARAVSFYDQVVHPDPQTWSYITLEQAAEKLLGIPFGEATQEDLLAVQTYLFDRGELYVGEQRRTLDTPVFWVRPRRNLEDIRAVHRMIKNRELAMDAFFEKARQAVTMNQSRRVESWTEPPSRHPLLGIEWTDSDKTILRFLMASVENRRFTQSDPYAMPQAHILKSLKMYNFEDSDIRAVHQFLIDLGVVAPWETLQTLQGRNREPLESVSLTPTTSTPIVPTPLGPEDLYDTDIAESLRHDFGDLPAYVVDDWTAEELDDGVSIEKIASDPDHIWLHVHVADPTTALPPTHGFAQHARELSATRYYVGGTIPMLPRHKKLDRFSLGHTPGSPNVTLTFSMKVNNKGDITDYKVRPSIIRNVRIIRYDEVDAVLGNPLVASEQPFGNPGGTPNHRSTGEVTSAMLSDLRSIAELSKRLAQRRVENGALTFGFPALDMRTSLRPVPPTLMGSGEPSTFCGFPDVLYQVRSTLESGARGIIAECMKAAGQVTSMFFRDRGIPALRRVIDGLHQERKGALQKLYASRGEGGSVDMYDAILARVTSQSGGYSTSPGPHSQLGILADVGYVKATSPLRRFGDLLVHWQIKHALLAEKGERASPILFDEAWLTRMGADLEARELEAKRAHVRDQQFWAHSFLLRWMNDPARGERTHDPLNELTARLIEDPKPASGTMKLQGKFFIPGLALQARCLFWAAETPVHLGEEAAVEITQIALGTIPLLDVKIKPRA